MWCTTPTVVPQGFGGRGSSQGSLGPSPEFN